MTAAAPIVRWFQGHSPLTHDERSILERLPVRIVEFAGGEDISCEGDRPPDCSLLLDGWACRYADTVDGKRQILAIHIPGDLFDSQSFLLERTDHSIRALTHCEVALMPHRTMLGIVESYPNLARVLWKEALVESARLRRWMVSVGQNDGLQRGAYLFCEIFARLQAAGLAAERSVEWPISQSTIAQAAAMSHVHMNRTIQSLRRAGLITLIKGRLKILDWDQLCKVGQFDPTYLHLAHDEGPESRRSG